MKRKKQDTSLTLDQMRKLAKIIRREFGSPFLAQGFVKARVTARCSLVLTLRIGHRSVNISHDLECLGSTTDVI